MDTGLIARDLPALLDQPPRPVSAVLAAALAAAGLWHGGAALAGFTVWAPLQQEIALQAPGAEAVTVQISVLGPDRVQISHAGQTHDLRRSGGRWACDGAPMAAQVAQTDGHIHVFDHGCHSFAPVDALARDIAAGAAGNVTLSAMPGLVKAVFVQAGQAVALGDRLAVLEAMKMEHTLTAGRDGVVAEVLVAAGAQVEAGAALIVLEDG